MKLSEILKTSLIKTPLKSSNKEGVLSELAEIASAVTSAITKLEILESLQARERQGPFSMGKSVSFPHIRTEKVQNIVIVLGTCPNGVDFNAPDKGLTKVAILCIVPKSDSDLYLKTLAGFLNYFASEINLLEIAKSKTPTEVVKHFSEWEANLGMYQTSSAK